MRRYYLLMPDKKSVALLGLISINVKKHINPGSRNALAENAPPLFIQTQHLNTHSTHTPVGLLIPLIALFFFQ